MTTEHEALRLSEWLDRCAESIEDHNAAAMLRTQHALIVQMAEALNNVNDTMYVDEGCGIYCLTKHFNDNKLIDAVGASDTYLKGPKT